MQDFDGPLPEGSLAMKQKKWCSPAVAKGVKIVVEVACNPIDLFNYYQMLFKKCLESC